MLSLGDSFLDERVDATFAVVQAAFPYLDKTDIVSPPKGATNGSVLARQLLVHILVTTFDLTKRQLDRAGLADRSTIRMACHAVEAYRASPGFAAFADHLATKARRAVELWEEQNG